jgi:hypothetical protein
MRGPLEEPNRSSVDVEVDVHGGGVVAEAGHGLHVTERRHDILERGQIVAHFEATIRVCSGDYLVSASAS